MKTIKGFERYKISEQGTVVNTRTGRILKIGKNQKGYSTIILSNSGSAKNFTIHRLVYMTYVGDIEAGLEINHIDGNKSNNHYSNLELITHKENMVKAVLTGNVKSGENCERSKSVNMIDVMTGICIKSFGSIQIATKETGVHGSSISNCINGIRKTAGGYKWELKK